MNRKDRTFGSIEQAVEEYFREIPTREGSPTPSQPKKEGEELAVRVTEATKAKLVDTLHKLQS